MEGAEAGEGPEEEEGLEEEEGGEGEPDGEEGRTAGAEEGEGGGGRGGRRLGAALPGGEVGGEEEGGAAEGDQAVREDAAGADGDVEKVRAGGGRGRGETIINLTADEEPPVGEVEDREKQTQREEETVPENHFERTLLGRHI